MLLVLMAVAVPLTASLVQTDGTAYAQSVTLSVSSGYPGTSVTVSGSGFADGDTYQIVFAPGTNFEQTLASTTTISGTTFSRVIAIPHAPWGQYNIYIVTSRGTFAPLFQINPRVTLSITSGTAGDEININGSGFRANTQVNVYFDENVVASVVTSEYGDFIAVNFTIPQLPAGNYGVYGSDGVATSPETTFTINEELSVNPTEGSVGDRVVIQGSGFGANSVITLYWDNTVVSRNTLVTSEQGAFSTTFTIPQSIRGIHNIIARDSAFRSASVTFLVRQTIVISPASGVPGDTITVTGRGFRPNVSVSISYSGTKVTTSPQSIQTNSTGSFSATFSVPSTISGSYAVQASDGVYSSTATFSLVSSITLNPTTGHVGTELQVRGSGFTPGGRIAVSYDGTRMVTVTADSAGSFSVSFTVPVSLAGTHTVTATDLTTQEVQASATFTMESTPPPTPTLLRPEYNTQTTTTPLFQWSAVTDPSGVTYELQVATDVNLTVLVLSEEGLLEPQYQVGEGESLELVKKDHPYYWRVRAIDNAANVGAWTTPGSFYTQDSTPPPMPSIISPENGSQAETTPRFEWTPVTDPSGVTYELQVARNSDFTIPVIVKTMLSQSSYQVSSSEQLDLTKKDKPYYWRVRAVDGAGNESDWTPTSTFYTEDSTPPPVPVLLTPEQGATEPGNTLFDWTDVTDPSGVSYSLQVAQDADFQYLVVYKQNLTMSQYQLSNMEELQSTTGNPPSPYYWRVRAVDGAQNYSDWSTPRAFYVGGFLQLRGWVLYVLLALGAAVFLVAGIFIGMRLKTPSPE